MTALQSLLWAVASMLFYTGPGPGPWFFEALTFPALAASGPLGVAVTFFLEPVVPQWSYPWLLFFATLTQWYTTWVLGMRALSIPSGKRRFWVALCIGSVAGVCWLSFYLQYLLLEGRYGA